MSPAAILVLAFGMSVDAFAAALSRGATAPRVRARDAVRAGAVFGLVETATPVIGWGLGALAASSIAAVDHWVAFILLGLVGAHSLAAALRRPDAAAPPARPRRWLLLATALGTSIDAMAVGVSLAVLGAEIWLIAPAIGLATFLMATGGMFAGRLLGSRAGRYAEGFAGLALIGLGTSILLEHLVG
ncbi:manganese efflux pump MntP [Falsiroseomonas selenitidurans]|uniref:Putative manganese efflux pump MntP n=1 Tax=Falsiroseomonas selenitidurans TaxID=2716335 RepID=A0ABX1E0I7_9PROT|nr:manganese efflux pump MntP family protein [Falsiroseomonas selenitidurans]NKC30165.1 manganese efflux pump [Falsiroseomonas selenitidurans]